MNTKQQETLIAIFKIRDLHRKYQDLYGDKWREIYDEDKANGCLMKDD